MAISDMAKLNRPGMASSFGGSKRTGLSKQASVNLSNSSSARSTSLFSLSGKSRYNWTPGVKVSGDTSKYNYQGVRTRLNGGGQIRRSVYSSGTSRVSDNFNYKVDNGSAYNTGMAVGQTIIGLGMLADKLGLFNSLKGADSTQSNTPVQQTNSQRLENAMRSTSGSQILSASSITSSSATEAFNKMAGATDSATLRSAIADAKTQYATMDAQTAQIEDAGKKAQSQISDITKNVAEKQKAVDDSNSNVSKNEQAVKSYQDKLSGLNSDYAAKCSALDTANANLETATSNLQGAESELSQANALPADDPTKAAKVSAAKAKVQQATQAKQAAETAKKEAETAKEQAYNAITENKEAIKTAEAQLTKAKEGLKEAKKELETKNKELQSAKDDLKKAKDAIDKLASHGQDMNTLASAIKQQEARLAKLEQSEVKEFGKLNSEIDKDNNRNTKLMGKIDGSDGFSNKELRRLNKVKVNDAENEVRINRATQLESSVVATAMNYAQGVTGADGNEYKFFTLKENGESYCFKNGQPISYDEMPDDVKAKF